MSVETDCPQSWWELFAVSLSSAASSVQAARAWGNLKSTRYHNYNVISEIRLGCTIQEALDCAAEIQSRSSFDNCYKTKWEIVQYLRNSYLAAALEDCSHLTDPDSIKVNIDVIAVWRCVLQDCINDILAAADCNKCVCDVLPFLCGKWLFLFYSR